MSEANQIVLEAVEQLQENLIRSHAAGLENRFIRRLLLAAVAVRLNSLIRGYSWVSVELLKRPYPLKTLPN